MAFPTRLKLRCLRRAGMAVGIGLLLAHGAAALEFVGRIELPGIQGRIDHLAFDEETGRLFVAALAANEVEVVDVGRMVRTARLPAWSEPQGVLVDRGSRRLLIADGGSGRLESLVGERRSGVIADLPDADNLRADPTSGAIFVGYGHAIAAVDPMQMRVLRRFPLPGHPEAFALSSRSPRMYVNVPATHQVVVIDRDRGVQIAAWDVSPSGENFPMALDDADERLFVATRRPGNFQVYDAQRGERVAELALCGDADDLFFDPAARLLYAICGEGVIAVLRQTGRDRYERTTTIATASGARTGLLVASRHRLFVAVPARRAKPAEVRIYRTD